VKAATHRGRCQLCDHLQKLPSGLLSLHGYTKRWAGVYSGSCPGSRNLPIEKSCDLLEAHACSARESAKDLRKAAAAREADTVTVWVHEEQETVGRRGWGTRTIRIGRAVNVADVRLEYGKLAWTDARGKRQDDGVWGAPGRGIEGQVLALNAKQAAALRAQGEKLDEYAAWLEERVRTWQPRELVQIDRVAERSSSRRPRMP
jgi:hypothetical protein